MLRLPPISTLFPYTTLFRSFLEPIAIHKAELLNPAPDVCLRDIQVALGVNRQRMAMCEVAQLMPGTTKTRRSEEHTSELQSHSDLVCRLLLEKKKKKKHNHK